MFTTRPELVGSLGMVSSTHWLASQSGMAVLEAGGNAFDAAVAAGLVLQVVEPHMNGLGGEVPIVAWDERSAKAFVLCGQGVAPQSATVEGFESLGLEIVPGNGHLPAVVPGAFGAWMLLLRDHGSLPLREVMKHAIGYARSGFVVLPAIADAVEGSADLFREHWPTSRDLWMPGGRPPAVGTLLTNPDLAGCYERVLREAESAGNDRCAQIEAARTCFYEGFVAEEIDRFSRREAMDVSGVPHAGFLRHEDLASWRPTIEDALSCDYRGCTVLKPGPWSQGPVFLQQLALLEGFDIDSLAGSPADLIHVVTECAKLAFADREAYYGDPTHVDVPVADLLSAEYNARRRSAVGETAVVDGLHPGSPGGRAPRLPQLPEQPQARAAALGEPMTRARAATHPGDTCHLDVADRFGNLVSATPSGGWLQDSPTVPGLGFSLSTRAQMFWLERGLPNTLAPGKRPRTTLTPTLALRDDGTKLAFGTPGGDMQDQWTLPFFLRHVHQAMNLQEAIDAPTWHTTHFPSSFFPRDAEPGHLYVESRVGEETVASLRRRGHLVHVEDPWSLGRVCAVARDGGGLLRGAANPRGAQAYAVGR